MKRFVVFLTSHLPIKISERDDFQLNAILHRDVIVFLKALSLLWNNSVTPKRGKGAS